MVAAPIDLLQSLPRRAPAEVRATLQRIATQSGGWARYGGERYWLLSWCNALTVTGWSTLEEAEAEARLLHTMACGHACREWHAILDMATIRYAGPSLFEAFCQSLPSRLNVLVNGPSTVRLDNGPWRRVPFLGPGAYRQPWLAYRAAPIYWSFDWGEGNYRYYERFGALVADSGMQALMEWFFYEVVSQPQWQRSGMELINGHCWSKCRAPLPACWCPRCIRLSRDWSGASSASVHRSHLATSGTVPCQHPSLRPKRTRTTTTSPRPGMG